MIPLFGPRMTQDVWHYQTIVLNQGRTLVENTLVENLVENVTDVVENECRRRKARNSPAGSARGFQAQRSGQDFPPRDLQENPGWRRDISPGPLRTANCAI